MANEVVKSSGNAVVKQGKSIKDMLSNPESSWGKELAKVLPSASEVAKFMAISMNQLADPKVGSKLATCTTASFYNSIMKAARVGVYPDGVNAYLIPYGNTCTLQFSYRGECDMLIRNGIAKKFITDIVRKNDTFIWRNGELVEHTPLGFDEEERGEIIGVWVRVILPDGSSLDGRLSKNEIEKIRAKSQNPNGVWEEWYEEMAKKACIKRAIKTLQNTPEVNDALADDNKEFDNKVRFDRSNRVNASDLLGGGEEEHQDGETIDV